MPEDSAPFTPAKECITSRQPLRSSINEDTWQRWNQYLYLSNEEATRKYLAKKNYDIQKNKDSYNSIVKRLQDNPTAKDVDDGDALNAALDQLSDPRIQSSSLRIASTPIDAKIISEIPFRYASEAVTIIMANLKGRSSGRRLWTFRDSRTRRKSLRTSPSRLGKKMRTARSRRRRSDGPTRWSRRSARSSPRARSLTPETTWRPSDFSKHSPDW